MCTDLGGRPWTRRGAANGWAVLARRIAARESVLLQTDDDTARTGWYAVTAFDATTSAAALEPDGSVVALTNGGRLILVDRGRSVAGAIAAGREGLFADLASSPAGFAASRDVDPATREVVTGRDVRGTFEAMTASRPASARTRRVFVGSFGRLIAATDRGVEVMSEPTAGFLEVARWADADAGDEPTFGWLREGMPAVLTRGAVAAMRCVSFATRPAAGSVPTQVLRGSH